VSKRNFVRRFKVAKKALQAGSQNIQPLVRNVGYNDIKIFRGVFKRVTGLTPQEYRNKYARA